VGHGPHHQGWIVGFARGAPPPDGGLFAVGATGLNLLDTLMMCGLYQVKPPPFKPGIEVIGVVARKDFDNQYAIGERCAVARIASRFHPHSAVRLPSPAGGRLIE
jgi:NADPH:quinone reductase-like Zn-dependent oxidoreductase